MRSDELLLAPLLAAGLLVGAAGPVDGQLRPLEPVDWSVFGDATWSLQVGAGVYDGQRASLAGTEGRLWELGSFTAAWTLGRVGLQVSGTAFRVFRDDTVFADPLGSTRAPDGHHRSDTGDYRVSTLIRIGSGDGPIDALVRFGVRLPTTDNQEGLERDRTDVFATVAGRWERGPLRLAGEAGIGILGTRDPHREQVDPILYTVSAGYRLGPLTPVLEVLGQHDTRSGSALRGTEDLSEIRLGLRTHGPHWLHLTLVRGLTDFSPDYGVVLGVGISR